MIGAALLASLADHLGFQPQLGLDANLKAAHLPHEKNAETAYLCTGDPLLGEGPQERAAELNLARERAVQSGLHWRNASAPSCLCSLTHPKMGLGAARNLDADMTGSAHRRTLMRRRPTESA